MASLLLKLHGIVMNVKRQFIITIANHEPVTVIIRHFQPSHFAVITVFLWINIRFMRIGNFRLINAKRGMRLEIR
ncbi:hypothetical protein SDC9_142822 [bioreactor metagenome]|uniref:Uncharacterized protein n=1 Tax=bioreactor metagenome TaxID=1076179 RepID=A0A645E1W4_9ZZZZ